MKHSAHRLSVRLMAVVMALASAACYGEVRRTYVHSRLFDGPDSASGTTIRFSGVSQGGNSPVRDEDPILADLGEAKSEPDEGLAEPRLLEAKQGVQIREASTAANSVGDRSGKSPRTARPATRSTPRSVSAPIDRWSNQRSSRTPEQKPLARALPGRETAEEVRIGSYQLRSNRASRASDAASRSYSDRAVRRAQVFEPVSGFAMVEGETMEDDASDGAMTEPEIMGSGVMGGPVPPLDSYSEPAYPGPTPGVCCPQWFHRRGTWFGGAEYLSVRPTFSEAPAYLREEVDADGNRTNTFTNYDFGYDGAFRAFLGYHFCQCNGEVLLSYTSIDGDAAAQSGTADLIGATPVLYVGHLDVNPGNGESLSTQASVGLDMFDVEFAKSLSLDGPADPCDDGCCSCPRWDVRWSAGVRIADVNWGLDSYRLSSNGAVQEAAHVAMDFNGAGPRLGIEGRRFGRSGRWLLFARGNLSLLLGDYDIRRTTVGDGTVNETLSTTRMIPVTEIELGGTWRATRCMAFSAGYLFHAWHDLGMTSEIPGELGSNDDANILAFDGLFIRGEWSF